VSKVAGEICFMKKIKFLAIIILLATGSMFGQIQTEYGVEFVPFQSGDSTYYTPEDTTVVIGRFGLVNTGKITVDVISLTFENNEGTPSVLQTLENIQLFHEGTPIGMVEASSTCIRFYSYPAALLQFQPEERDKFEIRARKTNFLSQSEIQLGLWNINIRIRIVGANYVSTQTEGLNFPNVLPEGEMGYYFLNGGLELIPLRITRSDFIPDGFEVVAGEDNIISLKAILTNNNSVDVNDTSLSIHTESTGNCAEEITSFTVSVFVEGMQQGVSRNLNPKGKETFNDLSVIIPANGQREVEFRMCTIESHAPGTIKFLINSAGAKTEETETIVPVFFEGSLLSFENPVEGSFLELVRHSVIKAGNSLSREISIYPNPVTNWLNISSPKEIEKTIIFNSTGQIVWTGNSEKINVSKLSSGLYSLHLQLQNGEITREKFFKQ